MIRFSLLTRNPGRTWERARTSSAESFRDYLLSPARLKHRFALFEAITLPSLDAQTNKNFQVVVMTSAQLPKIFLDRLFSLGSTRPYLRIRCFDESQSVARCASDAVQAFQGDCTRTITFRIDDDDALAETYIHQLYEAAKNLPSGHMVTFPDGLYLRSAGDNKLEMAPVRYPRIALGLARVGTQPGDTIFNAGNHARQPDIPVLEVQTNGPAWLRSVYSESDSASARDAFEAHVKSGKRAVHDAESVHSQIGEFFPLLDYRNMAVVLSDTEGEG